MKIEALILVCVNILNLLFCSNEFSQYKILTIELDGIIKHKIHLENVHLEATPHIIFASLAEEQIKI